MAITARTSAPSRVFIARLVGTPVFDPIGDQVGKVHDVVTIIRLTGAPRVVGLVVEVTARRRVFLPITRVTGIKPGAVISTGLLNMRRFEQRNVETLVISELLDRTVDMKDGSGRVVIEDVAMEQQRSRDWILTQLFVRRREGGGLFRRGETSLISVDDVTGLGPSEEAQGAATLLAQFGDLKAADLADVLHDLPEARRIEVAAELDNERLADVLEELGDEDRVGILSALEVGRAADVLEAMQPDDATDLVSDLPEQQASRLLELMEPEDARDIRRLLVYEDDEAGGLMTTEPIILPPEAAVASALAHARRQDINPALATMIIVSRPPLETPTGRYLGVLHLQRALREPPNEPIGSFLDTDLDPVSPKDSLLTVTRLLATYNYTMVPVVDEERHVLGAISVDDVLDELLPENWRDLDDEDEEVGNA
ncbi:MAG TPA: CBS domain-containing protein [Actinomycetaceae bacterium]|nr:CBS domain-containing protein [Actinomycetaceae bacterium]